MQNRVRFSDNTLVEVIGNVASGKTTLAKKLPEYTNLAYADIDLFEENPFMVPSVEDPTRWVFTEEVYFDFLRSKQIPKVLEELKHTPLVLDQGFHMPFYMYTINRYKQKHMTEKEWEFAQKLHSHLLEGAPVASTAVFLDVPVDVLLQRMNARGRKDEREHEKLYTREYLTQLEVGLREYVKTYIDANKMVITYNQHENSFTSYGNPHNEFVDLLRSLIAA